MATCIIDVEAAATFPVDSQTPPRRPEKRHLEQAPYSPIPERYKQRKRRRGSGPFQVLEGEALPGQSTDNTKESIAGNLKGDGAFPKRQSGQKFFQRQRCRQQATIFSEEARAALDRQCASFADDYFMAPALAKLDESAVASTVKAAAEAREGRDGGLEQSMNNGDGINISEIIQQRGDRWLDQLQTGFSVLMHGVGSKRDLLEAFADEKVLPWGVAIVRINGFSLQFSLVECLRSLLEHLCPTACPGGSSVDALVDRLRAVMPQVRPLCFVVHSLDMISPAHQTALAQLAATPDIHLVASTDSIWAPQVWGPRCVKNFNFCWEQVHTRQAYEAEAAGRYAGGLPRWALPSSGRRQGNNASMGLVLHSLTPSHRELVQVMASNQHEGGGRMGITVHKLLSLANDRMIANTMTKLRNLLNELKDHNVIMQKPGADGCTLFYLPVDARTLQCLAEGRPLEEGDGEESGNAAGE